MNHLYYGDCLSVMERIKLNSVDLIYLDPPFNSNRNYNAIYKDETGNPLPEQVDAFCDTWELTPEREHEARTVPALMRASGIDHDTANLWGLWMKALRKTQPSLLAYMTYMVPRLLRMYPLMKSTGSLYYHCDPTASHYIKPFLDAIFGHDYFQNEIVWRRVKGGKSDAGQYGRSSDRLLFYTRSDSFYFDPPRFPDHDPEVIEKWYRDHDDIGRYTKHKLTASGSTKGDSGQPWRGKAPTGHWVVPRILQGRYEEATGQKLTGSVRERLDILADNGFIEFSSNGLPYFRRYLHDAKPPRVHDIWVDADVKPMARNAKERMGYDTQKPLGLMRRIIETSCPPDGLVLDPFCGCATTLVAAHQLGRRWIGIDIAIHAIKRVSQVRLQDRCGLREGVHFEVDGIPNSVESAEALWKQDKYQFQKWAVEQIDGFCTTRQSADGGVDGRIYFYTDEHGDAIQNMIVEVKGGRRVGVSVLRELRGVVDREDALLGCLIVQHPPSRQQQREYNKEIIGAGRVILNGWEYPRLQVLSVQEILDGIRPAVPQPIGKREAQPALLPVV